MRVVECLLICGENEFRFDDEIFLLCLVFLWGLFVFEFGSISSLI